MDALVETLSCNRCGARLDGRDGRGSRSCRNCGEPLTANQEAAFDQESHTANGPLNLMLRLYCRVLIGLFLYVLSTGPMYWLIYEAFNMGGSSFLAKLYWPIALACENKYVCEWFDWYVGLWVY